ncbi:CHRD domain-containing protein [Marinobacterium arenosum]|uniref:CHRD domain-containing protein n=1 Tax=Marinobacterium arenosum TaxID=2862496 RepID=UPI001C96CC01|nr:CHRD domain-containing protein [Marinobacterium arenosum]MBY4678433.1 CHRD domain-containing protein [Marinobacterium arenosum]
MKKLTMTSLLTFALLIPFAAADSAVNFRVDLSGAQEVPPVETAATGSGHFHVNQQRSEIRFDLEIVDGIGILGVAGAHLHCAPAGENGPVVAFLAGMNPPSGFDGRLRIRATLTEASILDPSCGATIAELVEAMQQGEVYINVHSLANPAGEVRGQF